MKSTIHVTGQINGNFTLARAIGGERRDGMFNSFYLDFQTKGAAREAIRKAYMSLTQDEPEMRGRIGGVRSNRSRTELYYDASKAIIL